MSLGNTMAVGALFAGGLKLVWILVGGIVLAASAALIIRAVLIMPLVKRALEIYIRKNE